MVVLFRMRERKAASCDCRAMGPNQLLEPTAGRRNAAKQEFYYAFRAAVA